MTGPISADHLTASVRTVCLAELHSIVNSTPQGAVAHLHPTPHSTCSCMRSASLGQSCTSQQPSPDDHVRRIRELFFSTTWASALDPYLYRCPQRTELYRARRSSRPSRPEPWTGVGCRNLTRPSLSPVLAGLLPHLLSRVQSLNLVRREAREPAALRAMFAS